MSKIKFSGDSGGTGVFTIASPNSSTDRTITLPDSTGTLVETGLASSATLSFVVDEDNMASDSATKVPTQQSVKAYVDASVGAENTLAEDNDVNITSAADGSMLLYDTGTSMWIDNIMSGDATMADTGVISLAANTVDSSELVDGSIDTSHIADAQVTLAKVASQAANTVLVRDANSSGVVSAKAVADTQLLIGDGTGFTAATLSGDVTMTNAGVVSLAANTVDSAELVDGGVDASHLASDSVITAKILDANVTTAKIAADAITGAKIADDSVDSEHLAADSIDAEHYAAGSVDTTALGADAVTGAKIADDAINSEHIADGAIDTAFIKETFPDVYALKEKDGILQPEAIAEAYWSVHSQHRSAWTHELDLRPYMEKF